MTGVEKTLDSSCAFSPSPLCLPNCRLQVEQFVRPFPQDRRRGVLLRETEAVPGGLRAATRSALSMPGQSPVLRGSGEWWPEVARRKLGTSGLQRE